MGIYSIMWPFVKPECASIFWAIFLNGLHGFAITFQVFTVGWLMDWVLGKGHVPPDVWRRAMALSIGYFVISFFGRMLTWHLGYRIFTRIRERIISALRAVFFRHINALCLRFHMKRSSGELFSYLFGSPLSNIVQFYEHCSTSLAGSFTTIISAVVMLLWNDWVLTLILLLTVSLQILMMERARRIRRKIIADYQNLETSVSGTVADLIRGTRAVKLHAMEQKVDEDFREQMSLISNKSYDRDIRTHMEFMKQETIYYAGFSLMAAACAWRFSIGRITIGEVSMFMMALQQLSAPLASISTAFSLWGSAQASIERIGEVLRETSSTPDPLGNPQPVPPAGDLEFRNVIFSYDERMVLHGVSFKIPYGQRVAVVGPSGSGKSTIIQLMLRLYDPDHGEVRFGGRNLRECSGSEIRRRFGIVPQDPFIFRTTIRHNICVARPDADDAAVELACRQANAWEFIEKMPMCLDTAIGEGGSNLSGGQRQRLAIARALLSNPPVMIFDEATSALDTISEQLINETMKGVCDGRTAIIIAHRLSTVRECDRILVVSRGRIEQDGSYDELMAEEGLFRDLVRGQRLQG